MITNGLLIIKNTIINIDGYGIIQIEKDKLKLYRKGDRAVHELSLVDESPYDLSLSNTESSTTEIKLLSGTKAIILAVSE